MSNINAVPALELGAFGRACLLIVIVAAALSASPGPASANSPPQLNSHVGTRILNDTLWGESVVQPKPTALVSSDLVDRVTDLLDDGVRLSKETRQGVLYVHFEKQGLGGVVFLRYRR